MRKVTKTVVQAWLRGDAKTVDNTRTDGDRVYLHGNAIAKMEGGHIYIRTAGWNTVTTRERLNGILQLLNIRSGVCQRRHQLYLNDIPWDGEWLMIR